MGEGNLPLPRAKELGAVLIHAKKRKEISGGFRNTTNNRMEILIAIAGLEMLKQPCKVTIYSDSQYLVDATYGAAAGILPAVQPWLPARRMNSFE